MTPRWHRSTWPSAGRLAGAGEHPAPPLQCGGRLWGRAPCPWGLAPPFPGFRAPGPAPAPQEPHSEDGGPRAALLPVAEPESHLLGRGGQRCRPGAVQGWAPRRICARGTRRPCELAGPRHPGCPLLREHGAKPRLQSQHWQGQGTGTMESARRHHKHHSLLCWGDKGTRNTGWLGKGCRGGKGPHTPRGPRKSHGGGEASLHA